MTQKSSATASPMSAGRRRVLEEGRAGSRYRPRATFSGSPCWLPPRARAFTAARASLVRYRYLALGLGDNGHNVDGEVVRTSKDQANEQLAHARRQRQRRASGRTSSAT